MKKQLANAEDVTKESFDSMVATFVEEYAQKKEMVGDKKDELIASLQAKWNEMEAEYRAGNGE